MLTIAAARQSLIALSGKNSKDAQAALAEAAVTSLCTHIIMYGNKDAGPVFEDAHISTAVRKLALVERNEAITYRQTLKEQGLLLKNGQPGVGVHGKRSAEEQAAHDALIQQVENYCFSRGVAFTQARATAAADQAAKREATKAAKAAETRAAESAEAIEEEATYSAVKTSAPVSIFAIGDLLKAIEQGNADAIAAGEAVVLALKLRTQPTQVNAL